MDTEQPGYSQADPADLSTVAPQHIANAREDDQPEAHAGEFAPDRHEIDDALYPEGEDIARDDQPDETLENERDDEKDEG